MACVYIDGRFDIVDLCTSIYAEALEAMVRSLILEREEQRQRVEHESERANDLHGESLRQRKRADELYLEKPAAATGTATL
jgi:hypothetical protein